MTQQTLLYPTSIRRPISSMLGSLFRRTPSATPKTRFSGRPDLAYVHYRSQVTGTYPSVTGHEWAILMTMRPHS
jgi:hypothetical protein